MTTRQNLPALPSTPRSLASRHAGRVRAVAAMLCAPVLWLAHSGTSAGPINNLKQIGLGAVPVEDGGRTGLAAGRHTARLYSDGRNHLIEIGGQQLTAALRGCPADVAEAGFDERSRGETRPAADGSLRVVLHASGRRGCEAHAILPAVATVAPAVVPARTRAADALPALECRGGEVVATSRTGNAYCQCPQGQGAVAVAPNRFECRHAAARAPGTQGQTIRATGTRTEPATPAGTRAPASSGPQARPPSAGPGSRPPAPPTAPRATGGSGPPADDAARTGNRAAPPPPAPQGRPAQEPAEPTTSKPIPQCLASRVSATRSLAATRTGGIETARLAWELAVRTQHYASHAQWAHARDKHVDCQLAGTWTCTLTARPCRP